MDVKVLGQWFGLGTPNCMSPKVHEIIGVSYLRTVRKQKNARYFLINSIDSADLCLNKSFGEESDTDLIEPIHCLQLVNNLLTFVFRWKKMLLLININNQTLRRLTLTLWRTITNRGITLLRYFINGSLIIIYLFSPTTYIIIKHYKILTVQTFVVVRNPN